MAFQRFEGDPEDVIADAVDAVFLELGEHPCQRCLAEIDDDPEGIEAYCLACDSTSEEGV